MKKASTMFDVRDYGTKKRVLKEAEGLLFSNTQTTTHYIECCDCSLVHIVKVTPCKDGIGMQFWRDERKTAQRRRRNKEKEQCQKKSS